MKFPYLLSEKKERKNTTQLGAYAVYFFQYGMNKKRQGNQYGTISGKLSAVRWYHKRLVGYEPGLNASHGLLMGGIRRFSDPVMKKQPLTARMLRQLYRLLDMNNPKHQLLWGGALLGYFFLLRRSEYLKVDGKWFPYVLQLGNINFYNADENICRSNEATSVGIKLTGAKNNQFGRNELRYQHKTGDAILCPVMAAMWLKRAGRHYNTQSTEPAMSTGNHGGITSSALVAVIKKLAKSMGLDPNLYSSHSIRIGGATVLLNAGCHPLIIKLLGRWLSNCFESYPVLLASGTKGVSAMMC